MRLAFFLSALAMVLAQDATSATDTQTAATDTAAGTCDGYTDGDFRCGDWSSKGYCSNSHKGYQSWMYENCAKSCCDHESSGILYDYHPDCPKLGQYCYNIEVSENCRKTCQAAQEQLEAEAAAKAQQLIDDIANGMGDLPNATLKTVNEGIGCGNLTDNEEFGAGFGPNKCAVWANEKHCTSAEGENYMVSNCARTCCDRAASGVFDDNDNNCEKWALDGLCDVDLYEYVHKRCKKSCKKFAKSMKELGGNACKGWAKAGWCQKMRNVREELCPKTCESVAPKGNAGGKGKGKGNNKGGKGKGDAEDAKGKGKGASSQQQDGDKKQKEEADKAAKEAEKAAKEAAREADKAAKEAAREADKAAREAAREAEKAAREAAREAEKAEREAAKEADKAAREAEKAAREAEREAAREAEKAAREAEKAAREADREAAKAAREAEKAARDAEKASKQDQDNKKAEEAAKKAEEAVKKAEEAAKKAEELAQAAQEELSNAVGTASSEKARTEFGAPVDFNPAVGGKGKGGQGSSSQGGKGKGGKGKGRR